MPVVVVALAKSRLSRQTNFVHGGKDKEMGPEECDFRSGLLAGLWPAITFIIINIIPITAL